MSAQPSNKSGLTVGKPDGEGAQHLGGELSVRTLSQAQRMLRGRPQRLDLSGLGRIDTPGALFLCRLQQKGTELTGVGEEHRALLDLIGSLELKKIPRRKKPPLAAELVCRLGHAAVAGYRTAIEIVTFTGRSGVSVVQALRHPRTLRYGAIAHHVEATGIDAMPIIALMAGMIAVVIAYQGVAQLRPYGGEEFTVNLVAVSVLREMGVLLTAIMVAGRSGSAFTAEIGTMKAREEVDALTVMGLDPMALLVVPRILALVITLPLLTFFADMMGLLGGAIISHSLLDIGLTEYIQRVHQAVKFHDYFVGLSKAPVFAFFIAVVGCMHGLKVEGSAESVGRNTTQAVVKTIFLVLTLDALFSIFFERVGL
ncbi:MAG: MlaE family lipid ABC transporter permease subunit [Alphaproteobacteria bacterium]